MYHRYDDYQWGQSLPFMWIYGASHIVAIRENGWKFARYYDPSSDVTGITPQYEMYNLQEDPDEVNNIAFPLYNRTEEEQTQYDRLLNKLDRVIRTRLKPLPIERPLNLTVYRQKPGGDGGMLVTGTPVGQGDYDEVVTPKGGSCCCACKFKIKFTVWSGSGIITGTAKVTKSPGSDAANATYQGYANITTKGGTGAYYKITGTNLLFNQTANKTYIQGSVYW